MRLTAEEEDYCMYDTVECDHACPGCEYGPKEEEDYEDLIEETEE